MIGPTSRQLCVHGHFYQPPREDPFTGEVPREGGAEPYHDFNEKIAAECYRPNAALGNFSRISFDLGPTLATWLERHDRPTYRRILAQERMHYQRYGCSNALAQVYGHAIMPLASEREKRIQVAWGLTDFQHRFGHKAPGIWLAETAADDATLRVLADHGVGFTVLSPWQAAEPVDPSEPYFIPLSDGRTMTAYFYAGDLSGSVSFDAALTTDAEAFGERVLANHLNPEKLARQEQQLLLIASDGELYGHHQPLRQHFLAHLLRIVAPGQEFEVTSLARHLLANPPRHEVRLVEPSAWSCAHGVERWRAGCGCTEGDSGWKLPLRQALVNLAEAIDRHFEAEGGELLEAPWEAEEDYLDLRLGRLTPMAFLRRQARRPFTSAGRERIFALLEGLYHRHLMFASCAFFFDDLDRLEPRNAIAQGLRALASLPPDQQPAVGAAFEADLALARSWRTSRTGRDLLQDLLKRGTAALGLAGAA